MKNKKIEIDEEEEVFLTESKRKFRIALWKSFYGVIFLTVIFNFLWLVPELNDIRDRVYAHQVEITEKVESDVRFLFVSRIKSVASELSIFPFVEDVLLEDSGFKESDALNFLSNKKDVVEFSVINDSGEEILRVFDGSVVGGSDLNNVAKQTYFKKAKNNGYYAGVIHDKDGLTHSMESAKSVYFEDTGVSGVVYVRVNMKEDIKDYASRLQKTEKESVYILDIFGFVIDHYNKEKIGSNFKDMDLVKSVLDIAEKKEGPSEIKDKHSEEEIVFSGVYYDDNGEKIQATIRYLDSLGISIVVEEFYSDAWGSWRGILGLSIIGISLFTIMAVFLVRTGIAIIHSSDRLGKEKKQTETIVSSLPSGVIQYDSAFKIKLINPRAQSILGIDGEEIVGKKITSDTISEDPKYESLVKILYPALADDLKKIPTEEGQPKIMEMKIKRPNELDIQITTIPIVDGQNNNTTGYIKIIRDESREKAISRTKSEFISIAAHQLRTPLSAIKWIFKMVLDGDAGKITKEQADFLQKGYDSNERIIQLVNDMLNVARIEDGRFGYEFASADIVKTITGVVDGYALKAEEKKIKLVFEKPKENIAALKIDSARIELVLQNLIDNALKYTPDNGRIIVALSVIKDYVQISVKDSGVGVPEGQEDRLFSKFFRGSNVIKMQTEGTGLGLFITKNIIVRHGGKIWVETEEGKGTTFNFTIPTKESLIPSKEASEEAIKI